MGKHASKKSKKNNTPKRILEARESLTKATSSLDKIAHKFVGADKKPADETKAYKKAAHHTVPKAVFRKDHPHGPPAWTTPDKSSPEQRADSTAKKSFASHGDNGAEGGKSAKRNVKAASKTAKKATKKASKSVATAAKATKKLLK